MGEVVVTLPVPPQALRPNSRPHWRTKARATKAMRQTAALAAMAALGGKRPEWRRAVVQIEWFNKTARHIDGDNALSSLKAGFDGLADAGVVANDRGLTHLPVRFGKDAQNPRVVVTVREDK